MKRGDLFTLLTFVSSFLILGVHGIASEQASEAVVQTMTTHLYFSKITQILEKGKAVARNHPTLERVISISTGSSTDDIANHYSHLFEFFASNIETEEGDVGSHRHPYYVTRRNFRTEDINSLKDKFPTAILAFSKNPDMSWSQWSSYFGGNNRTALLALLASNDWVRRGAGEPKYDKKIQTFDHGTPLYQAILEIAQADPNFDKDDAYGTASFGEKAFGLNLKWGKKKTHDDGNLGNVYDYGRAYKTLAGINMALALYDQGYSAQDIQFAVGRAALIYETSDLLYDHIEKHREGVRQADDNWFSKNKDKDLPVQYDAFLEKVRSYLKTDPRLFREMVGAIGGIPKLAGLVSGLENMVDLDDEFDLTMMLIALKMERSDLFDQHIPALLEGFPDKYKKKILSLFESAVADTIEIEKGAIFVNANLSNEYRSPFSFGTDCQNDPIEFNGVLGLLNGVERILNYIP